MRVEHPQCLAAAEKWLEADVGVLVTGDVGCGRSTVLAELGRRAASRGVHVLTLRGAAATRDTPLAAFALHPLRVAPRSGDRVSVGEVRDHFLEELRGRRNLLVIDDVDLVDLASLAVIESLVEMSGCGLLCSVRLGVPNGPWRGLEVGGQPLARVPVETIGLRGAAAILEDHLDGAVDISLIASLTAWSGGNARAVLSLADAAVWSGAATRVDGVWTEVSPLEDVPHSLIADTFCAELEPEEVAALEALAWFGPLELAHARRLAGSRLMQRLMTLERVVTFRTRGGQTVLAAVAPPCLAHAVRTGMNVVRREELMEQFSATFEGPATPQLPQWWAGTHPHFWADGEPQQDPVDEPIPVVAQRLAAQTVLRRDAWRTSPSVATASPLLESLMNSAPPTEEVDAIFAGTPLDEDEDLFATVEFVVKQARWVAFRESDIDAGVAILEAFRDRAGPYAALLRAQVLAFECARRGPAELMAAAADFPLEPARENVWYVLLLGGLLMETGRPGEVLQILHEWDLDLDQDAGSVTDQLRTMRADALLLDGQVEEALAYSQECLTAAYDRLDPLGIRMHSRGVATALMFLGDVDGAWQVLSTVLRLGPPGPVNVSYYQRILSMAAVLRARQGDVNLAFGLINQLKGLPQVFPLVLDAMAPWAEAELLRAQGRTQEGVQLLWDAGIRRRDLGFAGSAVLCWLLRAEPCTSEELAELKAAWEGAPIPLFAPIVDLHTDLVDGDADQVLDALVRTGPVLGRWLIGRALEVVAERRAAAGLEPLSRSELLERWGPAIAAEASAVGLVTDEASSLSERELEVALLARSGLSNREIANRLYLSVRTVENHMYRTLRKLGLASRADLAGEWDPEGTTAV
ncbi:LuxR C-terminal-related transcriptional regulator [Marmoricola sp. RAF53]|uniref:helix-turn-helix transcriptional regulator n=1 Tax=Marmoricola sp. RAF53 TaxID=3233059 RepID=UPI003F97464D